VSYRENPSPFGARESTAPKRGRWTPLRWYRYLRRAQFSRFESFWYALIPQLIFRSKVPPG
jgi:hypothetical protein